MNVAPEKYRVPRREKGRSQSLNGTGVRRESALQPVEGTPWRYASSGETRREGTEESRAFGEWAENMARWQWFVTLTLDDKHVTMGFTKPGLGSARRALRALILRTGAKQFLAVFEMQESRGVPHVHALLAGCPAIIGSEAQKWFDYRYGFSRWKVFKENSGAPGYLGKYLAKELVEMYVGLEGPYDDNKLKGASLGGTRV